MELSLDELKSKALSLGWDDMGITSATIPDEEINSYQEWLSRGHHAKMSYMENQIRCSPQQLFPGAQTAILFVTHYKQPAESLTANKGLIASYARGRDYHHLHRKRLKKFISWLEERTGKKGIAKGFSDSTPILEKALAVQAGLGWLGKNTLLIHRRFGTFILLSGILTTLSLPHTSKEQDARLPHCGSCTRCMDACPTQALITPYQLDARRCLSYHLIESKEPIPEQIQALNPGYAFGCDICQNVCPHNAKKPISSTAEFLPQNGIGTFLTDELMEQLLEKPERLFGTPLQRKGAEGLFSNLRSLKKGNVSKQK
jgi:epoxyqueuosine reductase